MTETPLRAKLEAQLAEANEAKRVAFEKRSAATAAVTRAEHDLSTWETESKLRRPVAHRGLDALLELVPGTLRVRLAELHSQLCMAGEHGVAAVSPQTLAELAGLYLASTSEFGAVLHRLLDADPPPGHPELIDMTDAEHADHRAALKAELADLQAAKAAAVNAYAAAAQRVNRLELGHIEKAGR